MPSLTRRPARVEVLSVPTAESVAEARELLASLGREIESTERERAQIEGALGQTAQQFQEFGLADIKAVRKRLIQLRRDIGTKQTELVEKVKVIREEFPW